MSSRADLVGLPQLDVQIKEDATGVTTRSEGAVWRRGWRPLGRGGYGVVYLEECIEGEPPGAVRAVKVIDKINTGNIKTLNYSRELQAMARFSQLQYRRHFVQSFGWYEDAHSIFISMEYIEHGDLGRYQGASMPEQEMQTIVLQVLEGLGHMHSVGYAHRDLKPANLLVVNPGPQWHIKIADFGLSKRLTEGLSSTLSRRGTSGFMAPEILGLLDDPDPDNELEWRSYADAVDIWSLGVISFLMITTELPFPASDTRPLKKYIRGKSSFLQDKLIAHNISVSGCRWIQSCLAPAPVDRPKAGSSEKHSWPMAAVSASKANMQRYNSFMSDTTASARWDMQDSGVETSAPLSWQPPLSIDSIGTSENSSPPPGTPSKPQLDVLLSSDTRPPLVRPVGEKTAENKESNGTTGVKSSGSWKTAAASWLASRQQRKRSENDHVSRPSKPKPSLDVSSLEITQETSKMRTESATGATDIHNPVPRQDLLRDVQEGDVSMHKHIEPLLMPENLIRLDALDPKPQKLEWLRVADESAFALTHGARSGMRIISWSLRTGTLSDTFQIPTQFSSDTKVVLAPDCRTVFLSARKAPSIAHYNIGTGEHIKSFSVPESLDSGKRSEDICDVTVSPNGRLLVVTFRNSKIVVVTAATGEAVKIIETGDRDYKSKSAIMSKDGRYVAVQEPESLSIWVTNTGELLVRFRVGRRPPARSYVTDAHANAVFSPDSRLIASCCPRNDRYRIQISDLATVQQERTKLMSTPAVAQWKEDYVSKLEFSPNGQFYVTLQRRYDVPDVTILTLWDVASGALVTRVPTPGPINVWESCKFLSNGQLIAFACDLYGSNWHVLVLSVGVTHNR